MPHMRLWIVWVCGTKAAALMLGECPLRALAGLCAAARGAGAWNFRQCMPATCCSIRPGVVLQHRNAFIANAVAWLCSSESLFGAGYSGGE